MARGLVFTLVCIAALDDARAAPAPQMVGAQTQEDLDLMRRMEDLTNSEHHQECEDLIRIEHERYPESPLRALLYVQFLNQFDRGEHRFPSVPPLLMAVIH
jgi:hypothetical protein